MKVQVLSDIHVEKVPERAGLLSTLPVKADVLVLAGDLAASDEQLARLLRDAGGRWRHVVAVLGNHDYFGEGGGHRLTAARAAAPANVHVLEDSEVVLDGVRFVGATLWGAFRDLADDAAVEQTPFTAGEIRALNRQSITFLERSAPDAVVVTHYLPMPTCVLRDEFRHRLRFPYNPDTSSRICGGLLRHPVREARLWVSGHTHDAFDVVSRKEQSCRWVCNPLGLPHERTGADPEGLVVAIN